MGRNTSTRLTFNPGSDITPIWTPDGKHIPDTNFCLPPNADGSVEFGKITNVQTDPRAMQFGLKFTF